MFKICQTRITFFLKPNLNSTIFDELFKRQEVAFHV